MLEPRCPGQIALVVV